MPAPSVVQWFITANGREQGPFTPAQLKTLAEQGRLRPDMLVRRQDMATPVPASQVKGLLPTHPVIGEKDETHMAGLPVLPPAPARSAPPAARADEETDDAPSPPRPAPVRSAPQRPTGGSRPGPVRTVTAPVNGDSETKVPSTPPEDEDDPYAAPKVDVAARRSGGGAPSHGARFGAVLLDSVVMIIGALLIIVGFSALGAATQSTFMIVIAVVVGLAWIFAYQAVAEAMWGKSLGKMATGLLVINLRTGKRCSAGQAMGRNAVRLLLNLSSIGGLLDALWCLWEPDRRCLHDLAAGTAVVSASGRGRSSGARAAVGKRPTVGKRSAAAARRRR